VDGQGDKIWSLLSVAVCQLPSANVNSIIPQEQLFGAMNLYDDEFYALHL
jgi:hypothetical protein